MSVRGLALLGVLAALGVVLVPSATATFIPKYDACLQYDTSPGCTTTGVSTAVPAGAKVTLKLTIKNVSLPKLVSADLFAQGGFTIDPATVTYTSGSGSLGAGTSASKVELRSIKPPHGLALGNSVTVSFAVTAPCSTAGLSPTTWSVKAGTTNGSGNFKLNKATGLQSVLTGTCKLDWVMQPASAAKDSDITSVPYDEAGVAVAVGAENALGATIPAPNGVTLAKVAGDFTPVGASFSFGSATLVDGKATFSSLASSGGTGNGFRLQASASGFDPTGSSGPFDISLAGTACSGSSCSLPPTMVGNAQVSVATTGGTSTFLALNGVGLPKPLPDGCKYYESLGNAAIEVTGNTGVTELKYTISNTLLPHSHFPLFIPLCAGGQRVVDGNPVPCSTDEANGKKGWLGTELGSNHWFNGKLRYARCREEDGLWWGILGPGFIVNSNVNPSITSWYFSEGDTTTYVNKVPAPWDWRFG